MSKIKIGIVGTGSIVKTYQKCIDELADSQLVALYTKSEDRKAVAEKQFGVPVFSTMDDFLENDIDLVCVCNESGRHGEAIMAAARAGKHVLSEKPLETTPEKIDKIIEVCADHSVKLGCTLQNRCGTPYQRVLSAVRSGKLGKPIMGNAHINWYRNESYYADSDWKGTREYDGGAAFINQGIHTIDLLLHLMGPVTSVFGKVDTLVHDIEGEDVGAAILNFRNGAIGNITAGTALYPGYPERIDIYGEKGSILMEGGNVKAWNVKDASSAPQISDEIHGSGAADPEAIGHQNHKMVIADMIAAIRNDRSPMVDGAEARKAVAVINAIYEASQKGHLVDLSE
ncbi:Gfo/Idh/MocA family oxidoreductase [Pricia sp. S334]|uniref:Gfo/Idh/MocA family oxidoreductase n=1 Tax=Pricia mediterranea TaxID=3076079 RepID=A0ABU3L6E8_9FLAO|nr:Gfo/Idh/MocA family oxidoreductase [Pricia sp. S334]MDT7829309.1 Gfo/Idh/MocA family oxidoreductase [Pricia sp. S334]